MTASISHKEKFQSTGITHANYADNPPRKCCSCCCGRKVKRLIKHENALSQHEIDFTKVLRAEPAFEEKKTTF
jgi:hypothetical protein